MMQPRTSLCLVLLLTTLSFARLTLGVEVQSPTSVFVTGDSMAQDLTPQRLASGLAFVADKNPARSIENRAIGGNSSIVVGIRQGALEWTADVEDGTLPASGPVRLTNHRTPILTQAHAKYPELEVDFMKRSSWPDGLGSNTAVTARISGVEGEVIAKGTDRLFVRSKEGQAVTVTNPVEVEVIRSGPTDLTELNARIGIYWPFGPHLNNGITRDGVNVSPQIATDVEKQILKAMIGQLSHQRVILLYRQSTFPAPSYDTNWGRDRLELIALQEFYGSSYPKHYFDYVPVFKAGDAPMGVPSFKDWLKATHPDVYADPDRGWLAPFQINKDNGSAMVTPIEEKAVAEVALIRNGAHGVKSTERVDTTTPGGDHQMKTRLKLGIVAENGVAKRLWVREGGIGYEVGDVITIAAGVIGNQEPITAKVTRLRSETIGTVYDTNGGIDTANSYSQWDVDNGYVPRISRRDAVHFNALGADYLSMLLAARIKQLGW